MNPRVFYRCRFLCFWLSLLVGPVCLAENDSVDVPGHRTEQRGPWRWWTRLLDEDLWDQGHGRASRRIVHTVDRIDRFFGDETVDEINRSRLTLALGLEQDVREGTSLISKVRLRLLLPRLENRLQLVLDDAFEVDDPNDQQAIVDAVRDLKPDTGIRYYLTLKDRVRLSTDLGVRLRDPVQFYLRGRWSLRLPYEKWDFRLTEAVYWFTRDGWRSQSDFSITRLLPSHWQLRSGSRLVWEEISEGVEPSQNFSMTWQPTPRRAWRFFLSGVWPETPHTETANYVAGIVFRRRLHRDWFFMELSPAVEFPQAHEYQANLITRLQFEVIFTNE